MTNQATLTAGKNRITFKSFGVQLVGDLYLPEGFDPNQKYTAIVAASPFQQVKEQVEGIAQALNMTPRYLSDALKVETGKTALENIHAQQIEQAKNLLLGSDDSVTSIAYRLGFDYSQYFSRLFKNKVSMTPSQYRSERIH